MSDTVIKVENLSKQYQLGTIGSGTLYRDLQSWWAKVRGKEDPNTQLGKWDASQMDSDKSFWALKDVSFEVKQGDVLGIIGRNGAGKSTLLKVLSRVTGPSSGAIKIKGRVASLLEVGTGFHPELSGRENIYLNGTILGMRKTEIDRKFDEIVEFAEIEKFIDTPVKRYSSGMYVRLAFAVAAHLDPEILIVDEVLAVGDVEFQKKCLGKMRDVGNEGRTVLFVSHNMVAIEQMCRSALLLESGRLWHQSNNVRDIIIKYLNTSSDAKHASWVNDSDQYSNVYFQPLQFFIGDRVGNRISMPTSNDKEMYVHIVGKTEQLDGALQVGYALYDESERLIYWSCFNDMKEEQWPVMTLGENHIVSLIPPRFLNQGSYRLELINALYYREWINQPLENSPTITLNIQGGLSDSPYWLTKRPGILAPVFNWEKIEIGEA